MSDLSKGIDKCLKVFSNEDGTEKSTLEYISYKLEKPKFDVIECKQEVYLFCCTKSEFKVSCLRHRC